MSNLVLVEGEIVAMDSNGIWVKNPEGKEIHLSGIDLTNDARVGHAVKAAVDQETGKTIRLLNHGTGASLNFTLEDGSGEKTGWFIAGLALGIERSRDFLGMTLLLPIINAFTYFSTISNEKLRNEKAYNSALQFSLIVGVSWIVFFAILGPLAIFSLWGPSLAIIAFLGKMFTLSIDNEASRAEEAKKLLGE